MSYRFLKPAAAILLASSLSSCGYYHAWNGISYMMDEDKALTAETQKYREGEWHKQAASAAETAQVQQQFRRGYITDIAAFFSKFGSSDTVTSAMANAKDDVNFRFGKTWRYSQGSSHYFCSTFLVLDQDGQNRAKNQITPFFVEPDREPNMANASPAITKAICR
ncbi:hypothetical protein RJ498_003235 [Pluralibacter gergoviae]